MNLAHGHVHCRAAYNRPACLGGQDLKTRDRSVNRPVATPAVTLRLNDHGVIPSDLRPRLSIRRAPEGKVAAEPEALAAFGFRIG